MKTPYWIIGLIVLALLVWWLWSADDTTNTPPPSNNQAQEDDDNDDDTATTPDSLRVNLAAQNSSGQSGSVILTDLNGKTQVVVAMTGGSFTAPQPAHIHVGACPAPGAVKYALNNLVAGASTTTIDASIEQLRTSLPLAINVHKSAAETNVYTACGDIKF